MIVKAVFIRELALPFASRLKLPSIFIVSRKRKKKKEKEKEKKIGTGFCGLYFLVTESLSMREFIVAYVGYSNRENEKC